jgi:hypothetical protein
MSSQASQASQQQGAESRGHTLESREQRAESSPWHPKNNFQYKLPMGRMSSQDSQPPQQQRADPCEFTAYTAFLWFSRPFPGYAGIHSMHSTSFIMHSRVSLCIRQYAFDKLHYFRTVGTRQVFLHSVRSPGFIFSHARHSPGLILSYTRHTPDLISASSRRHSLHQASPGSGVH